MLRGAYRNGTSVWLYATTASLEDSFWLDNEHKKKNERKLHPQM